MRGRDPIPHLYGLLRCPVACAERVGWVGGGGSEAGGGGGAGAGTSGGWPLQSLQRGGGEE